MKKKRKYKHPLDFFWDLWCLVSFIGIWPRFIEPYLLTTTRLKLPVRNLPSKLKGLRIVQFSDLHLHPRVPTRFLEVLSKKINKLEPDIIVFTGDFLCYGVFQESERLKNFLCSLKAKAGCFAILGNHDYEKFISINSIGEYDVLSKRPTSLTRAFKRLVTSTALAKRANPRVREVPENVELLKLLDETPFQLLNNESILTPVRNSHINITGLGEYMLEKCLPEEAFKNYDKHFPGIILTHNPDSVELIKDYPGEVILSGHTHGGQVYLPWIWKKFALMENMDYVRGLKKVGSKSLFISRGVGSVMPFRWLSMPEIVLLELDKK